MSYAVQVRWSDGYWMYVMNGAPFAEQRVQEYDSRDAAEEMAAMWIKPGHEDAVRVVEVEEP